MRQACSIRCLHDIGAWDLALTQQRQQRPGGNLDQTPEVQDRRGPRILADQLVGQGAPDAEHACSFLDRERSGEIIVRRFRYRGHQLLRSDVLRAIAPAQHMPVSDILLVFQATSSLLQILEFQSQRFSTFRRGEARLLVLDRDA